MKRFLSGLAVCALLARGASAQTPSPRLAATSLVGTWRGTSLCLVRPSPCNDEIVIYRITRTRAANSLTMDARKIVRGEEEEMGTFTCHLTPPDGPLACVMPRGTWRFEVRKDSLVGELRLTDDTKYRDVRTVRSH